MVQISMPVVALYLYIQNIECVNISQDVAFHIWKSAWLSLYKQLWTPWCIGSIILLNVGLGVFVIDYWPNLPQNLKKNKISYTGEVSKTSIDWEKMSSNDLNYFSIMKLVLINIEFDFQMSNGFFEKTLLILKTIRNITFLDMIPLIIKDMVTIYNIFVNEKGTKTSMEVAVELTELFGQMNSHMVFIIWGTLITYFYLYLKQ